ncbi:MAG: ABC transporter substrate-binding protein [Fimbriimonas sp.]
MTKWGFLFAAVLLAAGCGDGGGTSASGTAKKRVGFVQFTTTSSLDDTREGYIRGLAEGGFKQGDNLDMEIQNAQGDTGSVALILQKYQQDGMDLVAPVGTPALQAAVRTIKDRPVVFAAIVSAVATGAATTEEKGKPGITGITNPFPIDKGMALVKECMPNVKKIGTLYDPGEAFAERQLAQGKEACDAMGVEWVPVPVNQSNDIATGIQALKARGVEAIMQLPSNTINQGLEGQVKEAQKQGIPMFSVQADQVAKGVIAAIGVDLFEAGREAGNVAAEILKGKKPEEIPIRPATKMPLKASEENAAKFGITLPKSLLDKAEKA